ncbi:MAG: hypothetical protein ACI96W_003154 [Paraglaciecola sp.]|jgi:hypothetical protein
MNNKLPNRMNKLAITLLLSVALISLLNPLAAEEMAGKTMMTKGDVRATETTSSTERTLKRRSPIYTADSVKTDAQSKAQLRMTDGGMIALKENSELLISSYDFNADDQTGSVVMELFKGGLRSVTGAIKSDKGNYQLKTPIGSIGIRGTHYEIEIIQDEVFIAVWDGAVDVSIDISGKQQETSLGEGEDFAYAKIDESGEVTELLEPPENFNEGHSSDPDTEQGQNSGGDDNAEGAQGQQNKEGEAVAIVEEDLSELEQQQQEDEVVIIDTPIGEETDFLAEDSVEEALGQLTPEEEITSLVADRTGTLTYSSVSDVLFSEGSGSNFEASITIDFDTASIPSGNLSFDDDSGEWFAAFSGAINESALELGVNFASHGNNLATGQVDSTFINGIDGLFNSFELFEIDDTDTRVKGTFKLD